MIKSLHLPRNFFIVTLSCDLIFRFLMKQLNKHFFLFKVSASNILIILRRNRPSHNFLKPIMKRFFLLTLSRCDNQSFIAKFNIFLCLYFIARSSAIFARLCLRVMVRHTFNAFAFFLEFDDP